MVCGNGSAPIEEVATHFGIDSLPDGEAGAYHTIGGFVMARLGRVPKTADASGLVVAEAVIGQLYLAVLVARLVGLHLSAYRDDHAERAAPPTERSWRTR